LTTPTVKATSTVEKRVSNAKGRWSRPFATSPVEKAHERLGSPADVLARHGIRVRRNKALCPFHPDKTPSLSLYRDGPHGRAKWKCFGCGEGGDAIDLEARLSGRSVREVIHG
jgi:hypothetical protein